MYYPNNIEEICWNQDHIEKVWNEMQKSIPTYFQKYIDTESGQAISESDIEKLAAKFGSTSTPNSKPRNATEILRRLLRESIVNYEKDRQSYQDILNLEALEEYKHDVNSFKNTVLKNQIPIINKTLNSKAKELEKFKIAFKHSQAGDFFRVTFNIVKLAYEWRSNWYEEDKFEEINTCDDLEYYELDGDEYIVYGVIGGGIKSQFIYKLFPEMYPNRNREAIWALYYLCNKQRFGCREDSEFLMINSKEGTTVQNYFYPYSLFAFYALQIFKKLRVLYSEHGIILPNEHRFVAVDSFLSSVARIHQAEIDSLKQKSNTYHYDY
jgi:hypothetical protein